MPGSELSTADRCILWARAAGRCEYRGCNDVLWRDVITKARLNTAYVAHIVAAKPDGPRGDPVRSPALKGDLSNVMLLCDKHHRMIDKTDVEGHPEAVLLDMKGTHERRVEDVTAAQDGMQSEPVLYGARVGQHDSPLTYDAARRAMLPARYPARAEPTMLGMRSVEITDDEEQYWDLEALSLRRQFSTRVTQRIRDGDVEHMSVFAFAPQPLLVMLGWLLGDIRPAEVYQLHREPPGWCWQDDSTALDLAVEEPTQAGGVPALVFSVSATVSTDRVRAVLGPDAAVWIIRVPQPANTLLTQRRHLQEFRQVVRQTMDRVKAVHGEHETLHVFPALPVSAAVELGRVWMPKADLPMLIYDQNRSRDGFAPALSIPHQGDDR